MSIPYALRYALVSDEVDAKMLAWIRERSPGHLVVRHDADEDEQRVHWHALMWSDKKEQALRVDLKKANPGCIGNKGYSLTECKKKKDDDFVESYERYMCHANCEGDKVVIVSAHGIKYNQAWAQQQNAAFYAARKEYVKAQKKKQVGQTAVDELVDKCRGMGLSSRHDIVLQTIDWFADRGKGVDVFRVRATANNVVLRLDRTMRHEMAAAVMERW